MTGQGRDRKGEQLPLAFDHGAQTGRDDLIVSDPLSAAVTLVDGWPDWPSPVIILVGPPGTGKSHLVRIFRDRSGALLVSADKGSNAAALAVDHDIVIEDADRNGFDETELFHLINAVRQHGRHLMITARAWPISWPVTLPDLASRLKAATIVEIGEPDLKLLEQVLHKLFADRQLNVEDRLVSYLVTRMERSLGAAVDIVDRLDKLALARGKAITRSLAAEVLDQMEEGSKGD